jgi:hypothetical protein
VLTMNPTDNSSLPLTMNADTTLVTSHNAAGETRLVSASELSELATCLPCDTRSNTVRGAVDGRRKKSVV